MIGHAVLAPQAQAQGDMTQQLAAFKAAQVQNATAQRGYTWLEVTQLALKGEVKSTETSTCQYVGDAGKPKCTPAAPAEEKKSKGPVRKNIIEKKVGEMTEYMDSVKTLIAQYVPPQQDKIAAAKGRGDVATAPNPSTGTLKITISNYLLKGDAVTLVLSPATNQLVSMDVKTWLNDPAATVTLSVQFKTLPNGVTFPTQKVLTAAAKSIAVTTTSSNFAQAVAQ